MYTGTRHNDYSDPANHYSLTDSPGSLRYGLNPMTHYDGFLNGYQPFLSTYWYDPGLEIYRSLAGDRWRLETKVTHYLPYTNGRLFSLRAYFGNGGEGRDNAYNALRFSVRTMTGGTPASPTGQWLAYAPVPVVGDTIGENNESFTVTLGTPSLGTLADSQGTVTILTGDPSLAISDGDPRNVPEGEYGLHFVRNRMGQEVDFLVTGDGKPLFLVEAKHSNPEVPAPLTSFTRKLGVPAILLVNRAGISRRAVAHEPLVTVVSAESWLAALP